MFPAEISRKKVNETMSASAFTLAIFKPHLLNNPVAYCATEQLIAASGIRIVSRKKLRLTERQAKQFYRDHEGKFFYGRLISLMTSGPLEVLILSGENVIARWRALMGPTKVFKAVYTNPDCVRSLYGLSDTRNASHGSGESKPTTFRIQRSILFKVQN